MTGRVELYLKSQRRMIVYKARCQEQENESIDELKKKHKFSENAKYVSIYHGAFYGAYLPEVRNSDFWQFQPKTTMNG